MDLRALDHHVAAGLDVDLARAVDRDVTRDKLEF